MNNVYALVEHFYENNIDAEPILSQDFLEKYPVSYTHLPGHMTFEIDACTVLCHNLTYKKDTQWSVTALRVFLSFLWGELSS